MYQCFLVFESGLSRSSLRASCAKNIKFYNMKTATERDQDMQARCG